MYKGILLSHELVHLDSFLLFIKGFPGGSDGKESVCSAGDQGSIPSLGRSPGARHGNPLQYFCLENPHRQKTPAGYSPCGHKESDTTEWLNTHTEEKNLFLKNWP